MLKITNAVTDPEKYFNNGFSLTDWGNYITVHLPGLKKLFLDDLQSSGYDFERDCLPVLENALNDTYLQAQAMTSFELVTESLNEKIAQKFNKTVDAEVILYLGLCSGAGWVVEHENVQYVLLGLEKIIELGWCGKDDMYGLIYHELGHIYQMQYGHSDGEGFLWQLFTEGFAMYFEQELVGNENYFHQDRNGWLAWCDENKAQIINDFNALLPSMTRENQCFFGDWVNYKGHPDTGYYLGAEFVRYISRRYSCDEMINLDISAIRLRWNEFLNENRII